MGSHKLLYNCDRALVAYIIAGGAGTADDVVPLKASTSKVLPITICESRRGTALADGPYLGNYEVAASIKIRQTGVSDDASENETGQPAVDASGRVGDTFDLFHVGDGQSGEPLANLINAAAAGIDLTIMSAKFEGVEQGFEREGFGWCDILHLTLICAPSSGL